ncbi:hypothetical protein HYR69_02785 [Candidatus Sumerlaeota bacterium]|nr:hypothetical protein [Candidatus Sumerlaeota bacterium]
MFAPNPPQKFVRLSVRPHLNRAAILILGAILVPFLGCPVGRGSDRIKSKSRAEAGEDISIVGLEGKSLGRFFFPRGIDITPQGLMAIADKTGRIQLIDIYKGPVRQWDMPKMDNGTPTGVLFDLSDPTTTTLLVADTHNSRIMRYGLDGTLIKMWGEYGGEVGHMIYPTNLAVDEKSFIYITDYGENDRVLKFDKDANFIKEFGGFGPEPGHFQRPLALIYLPPEKLIIADSCNHRLATFTTDGKFVGTWGEVGKSPGQFNYPYDLTLGRDGLIYVAEFGNNRIQVLDKGRNPGSLGLHVASRRPRMAGSSSPIQTITGFRR